MLVAGIDPGVSPAVAFVGDGAAFAERIPQVGHLFDEKALRKVLRLHRPACAVVELVGPMAGQGLSSTAHFMAAWGLIRGILCGMGIRYDLVTPQVWKRDVLPPCEESDPGKRKAAQKAAAVALVARKYPGIVLVRPRCRTPDHNLAEAACLAHWKLHGQD
mgnify:CR=1 FL=1